MKYTYRLFGAITLVEDNVTWLGAVLLGMLSLVTNLLVGAFALWAGSNLLDRYVTAFSVPTLSFLEAALIFAVTSFVLWIYRVSSSSV